MALEGGGRCQEGSHVSGFGLVQPCQSAGLLGASHLLPEFSAKPFCRTKPPSRPPITSRTPLLESMLKVTFLSLDIVTFGPGSFSSGASWPAGCWAAPLCSRSTSSCHNHRYPQQHPESPGWGHLCLSASTIDSPSGKYSHGRVAYCLEVGTSSMSLSSSPPGSLSFPPCATGSW